MAPLTLPHHDPLQEHFQSETDRRIICLFLFLSGACWNIRFYLITIETNLIDSMCIHGCRFDVNNMIGAAKWSKIWSHGHTSKQSFNPTHHLSSTLPTTRYHNTCILSAPPTTLSSTFPFNHTHYLISSPTHLPSFKAPVFLAHPPPWQQLSLPYSKHILFQPLPPPFQHFVPL